MDFRELVEIGRKHWRLIAVTVITGMASGFLVAQLQTPKFEASTRLFFAVPGDQSVADLAQGSSFTEKQMSSYAAVAVSPLVLEPVAEALEIEGGAAELSRMVRVSIPVNTVIVQIVASHPDAAVAAEIANAVGEQFKGVVGELYPVRLDGTVAVLATTLAVAEPSSSPTSPNKRSNVALGAFLGGVAGMVLAILRTRLDTRVRSRRDLEPLAPGGVLASISFDPDTVDRPLYMIDRPNSMCAEAVRHLRTSLRYVTLEGGSRVVLMTSSIPSEGKTVTALNLAIALCDAGERTVLVDADLRRPSVAKLTGLEGGAGLTSVLIGKAEVADVLQPWRGGLDILPAGHIPPNPSELLGSGSMTLLLERLRATHSFVIVDSAPLLPVTDTAALSKSADGVVMVVGADRVRLPDVQAAVRSLESVGAKVFGFVLNRVRKGALDAEPGTYGGGYSYQSDAAAP